MKYISIGKIKKHCLITVDDEDYERIKKYNWFIEGKLYPIEKIKCAIYKWDNYNKSNDRRINLTNFIMNNYENMYDHKDRNPLNNQKENLRICTHSQNAINSGPRMGKKYKGVTYHKYNNNWVAKIRYLNTRKHIGCYKTEIEAAKAYDEAAKYYHGEFAYLNFPDNKEK